MEKIIADLCTEIGRNEILMNQPLRVQVGKNSSVKLSLLFPLFRNLSEMSETSVHQKIAVERTGPHPTIFQEKRRGE